MPVRRTEGMPDHARLARIRLIFSDLDETLLGPDHRVGPRSRQAITALQQRGVLFTVCTGRAPQATLPLVRSLGARYCVCNNGATVHDGEQTLAESLLPPEVAGEMAGFFDAHGCPTYLHSPVGYLVTRMTPAIAAASAVRGVEPVVVGAGDRTVPAHKVMPFGAAHLYDEAVARWGRSAQIVYHPDYLEIGPPGVSKGAGARVLAQRLGIPAGDIAAMGDALNDIELLTWAGIGAAMANGAAETRAAAGWILPDHGADGTADLLEAVLGALPG